MAKYFYWSSQAKLKRGPVPFRAEQPLVYFFCIVLLLILRPNAILWAICLLF